MLRPALKPFVHRGDDNLGVPRIGHDHQLNTLAVERTGNCKPERILHGRLVEQVLVAERDAIVLQVGADALSDSLDRGHALGEGLRIVN